MNEDNRRLQTTFMFSSADLRANRSARLSPGQQARLRAARGSQRLAMIVFGVVMIASLAVVAVGGWISASDSGVSLAELLPQLAIMAVVVGGVILIGLLASRPYLARSDPRQALMAVGPAAVGRVDPDKAYYEIRIGAARLRLVTQEHLEAFTPGVEYRVFYLPGPVVTILSGEVVGSGADAEMDLPGEITRPEADPVVQLQRRARPVLIVLGILAIGIPLVGFLASTVSGGLRWAVMAGLLILAVAFVVWALRRIQA